MITVTSSPPLKGKKKIYITFFYILTELENLIKQNLSTRVFLNVSKTFSNLFFTFFPELLIHDPLFSSFDCSELSALLQSSSMASFFQPPSPPPTSCPPPISSARPSYFFQQPQSSTVTP